MHRRSGTYRSDRHRQEAQAPGPWRRRGRRRGFSKRQRQIWCEVLADAPYGLLPRIDQQLLVNYVELVARHETAAIAQRKRDQAATSRLLIEGSEHLVVSPYVRFMNHCVMLMTRLQTEMGFTPSSRVSLGSALLPAGEAPASEHELFDVILPSGQRIPYGARRQ
jgi:phage terminase small subunit